MGSHGHSHSPKDGIEDSATAPVATDNFVDSRLRESFNVVSNEAHNVTVLDEAGRSRFQEDGEHCELCEKDFHTYSVAYGCAVNL
jgi:hypothetical protein